MPRFRVSIPFTAQLVYEIKAEDAESADGQEATFKVYEDATRGLSVARATVSGQDVTPRLSVHWPETADFDRIDIVQIKD